MQSNRQISSGVLLFVCLAAVAIRAEQGDSSAASHHADRLASSDLKVAGEALRDGDHETARRELNRILAHQPHNPQALNLKGVLEAMEGNRQSAEALFRQALHAAPHLAAAHGNLARILRQTGRLDLAVPEFEQAIRDGDSGEASQSDYLDALQELVLAQRGAGDQEAALATLIAARRLLPDNPRVLYYFGSQAMGMGLHQDGVEALRKAHEIVPEDLTYGGAWTGRRTPGRRSSH